MLEFLTTLRLGKTTMPAVDEFHQTKARLAELRAGRRALDTEMAALRLHLAGNPDDLTSKVRLEALDRQRAETVEAATKLAPVWERLQRARGRQQVETVRADYIAAVARMAAALAALDQANAELAAIRNGIQPQARSLLPDVAMPSLGSRSVPGSTLWRWFDDASRAGLLPREGASL